MEKRKSGKAINIYLERNWKVWNSFSDFWQLHMKCIKDWFWKHGEYRIYKSQFRVIYEWSILGVVIWTALNTYEFFIRQLKEIVCENLNSLKQDNNSKPRPRIVFLSSRKWWLWSVYCTCSELFFVVNRSNWFARPECLKCEQHESILFYLVTINE